MTYHIFNKPSFGCELTECFFPKRITCLTQDEDYGRVLYYSFPANVYTACEILCHLISHFRCKLCFQLLWSIVMFCYIRFQSLQICTYRFNCMYITKFNWMYNVFTKAWGVTSLITCPCYILLQINPCNVVIQHFL